MTGTREAFAAQVDQVVAVVAWCGCGIGSWSSVNEPAGWSREWIWTAVEGMPNEGWRSGLTHLDP